MILTKKTGWTLCLLKKKKKRPKVTPQEGTQNHSEKTGFVSRMCAPVAHDHGVGLVEHIQTNLLVANLENGLQHKKLIDKTGLGIEQLIDIRVRLSLDRFLL